MAQGWPSSYSGVMLQGFYWDSFDDSQWTMLEKKADDLSGYFDLVWVPQSGKAAGSKSMGYDPLYYFNQNSSFGTEAELKSMIRTFKEKHIGTIADVVINHHGTNNGWFGFPAETYKGVSYQHQSTDVCANDDGGKAAEQARKEGVQLSRNNDEGEDWGGMRDLDHNSQNVQTIVKAYEDYLLNDLGYAGFRYDMVKGFAASHVGDYNTAAGVKYSVGEYWDGNANTVKAWIDGTGKRSAAFDFAFRYSVRDAINSQNWTVLGNSYTTGLNVDNGAYKRYSVTFVENHDVEYRSVSEQQDPIRRDTLAANAYLLAMPGTPCVFYKHYLAYPKEIKAMIDARKLAGITNESAYQMYRSSKDYYANVKLVAVSADDNAQLVYTLDGSTPTIGSHKVANGAEITLPEGNTILKVAVLSNGKIGEQVLTRTYMVKQAEPFVPQTIRVYVNTEQVGWNDYVNIHSWSGTHVGTSWPGDKVTSKTTANGKTWFYKDYTLTKANDYVNFVFNIGTATTAANNQTLDIERVNKTSYFVVTSTKEDGKYKVNDETFSVTKIDNIHAKEAPASTDNHYYTLSGQRLSSVPTQPGIYIHRGEKVVIK